MEDFYWFLSAFIVILGGLGCLFLGYFLKLIQRSTLKKIGLGFIFGFIALLILSIVFWIVWYDCDVYQLANREYLHLRWVSNVIDCDCIWGSVVRVSPKDDPENHHTYIWQVPEIVISREGTKSGIQNQTAVKIFVAETTCILVYLVTLIVLCLTSIFVPDYLYPGLSTGLTIAILLIGFILGPVLAIFIFQNFHILIIMKHIRIGKGFK